MKTDLYKENVVIEECLKTWMGFFFVREKMVQAKFSRQEKEIEIGNLSRCYNLLAEY